MSFVYTTGSFGYVIDECMYLNNQINVIYASPRVGTEGFVDGVKRLITGLANLISKMFATYKLIYRSFRDLKATELHKYRESKRATMYRVQNQEFAALQNLQVPIPKNLNTTYHKVATQITNCLQLCDMVNRSKLFAKVSSDIASKLKQDKFTVDVLVRLDSQQPEIDRITSSRSLVELCFDKSVSDTTKEFKSVYTSISDFKAVEKVIDDGCKYEYAVGTIYKSLESCSDNMNDAARHAQTLKDNLAITKADLLALSNATMFIAKLFDLYGVTVKDFNRVEHNYIECIKSIERQLKL